MKLIHYPHPALRHPVPPLTSMDKQVRLDAGRMLEIMYEAKGIGLAAPQVMLNYQMLVVNPTGDAEKREVELICLNPVIIERKGTIEGEEGCLSFPGLYGMVRRSKTVRVQFYNLDGVLQEAVVSELMSRIFQHEIDHLHGDLFVDKMSEVSKRASRGAIAKFEADYRKAQNKGEIPSDDEIKKMLKEREHPPIL